MRPTLPGTGMGGIRYRVQEEGSKDQVTGLGDHRPVLLCRVLHWCLKATHPLPHLLRGTPHAAMPPISPPFIHQFWSHQVQQRPQPYTSQSHLPQYQEKQVSLRQGPPRQRPAAQQVNPPICGLFNSIHENRCNLQWCTFRHICSACGGSRNRARCNIGMQTRGPQAQINFTSDPPPAKRLTGRSRGKFGN